MKRIWIVGSLGHMGQALINLLDMKSYELYETDKDEVDITDEEQVFTFMNRNRLMSLSTAPVIMLTLLMAFPIPTGLTASMP